MDRDPLRRLLVLAAVAATALLGATLPGISGATGAEARPARAAANTHTPLTVRLTSLSPAVIPRKGALRMRGTVRNDSKEAWQDINVDAFVSTSPITSADELSAAAKTPYDDEVGTRLITSNAFVSVGDLAPGQSTRFALRIPRAELPIPDLPGVYWVGVHALGADAAGRDKVADGRARTFMPLVRAKTPRAKVDLVLPFRAKVRREDTGALRDSGRWRALIGERGRLGRLAGFAESAGATDALTLVVDPAVLDAVDTLRTGPTDPTNPSTPASSASPSASPSGSPSDETTQPSPSSPVTPRAKTASGPAAAQAKQWLDRFKAVAGAHQVLDTGYADPDLAALAAQDPKLLEDAYVLGDATLRSYQIQAGRVAAPEDGYLPGSAVANLDGATEVLLEDHGLGVRRPAWRTTAGQSLVFGDTATASGGPGPGPRLDALSLRQRIVSAAALRAQSGSRSPVVVILPGYWDPGPHWQAADFFASLDLPWLRLAALPDNPSAPVRQNLAFPEGARAAQLDTSMVTTAKAVVAQSRVYAETLTRPDHVVDALTRLALQTTSYHARGDAASARLEGVALQRAIADRLAGIRVVVQPLVSMSGGSGKVVVTLVNGLDKRVRVGIRASTDTPGLTITAPPPAVLSAGQRATVRLSVQASAAGVRQVVLSPVTAQDVKVGTPATFTMRSNEVGRLIWVIMGAGGALLLVMIVRRWFKRGLAGSSRQ